MVDDERSTRGPQSDERVVIKPTRRRRKSTLTPTVERIAPPRRPTWRDTGEFRLEDLDDSGVFEVDARSAEVEIAPLLSSQPKRAPTPVERRLRVGTAALLVLLLLVFFWQAMVGATRRVVTGEPSDRWRAVALRVKSTPPGARVFIEDRLRGTAPLSTTERCRGRAIRVRVEAPGYAIWQWSGICPAAGIDLRADLQRE